ncbi:MAG: hypothetical protein WB421_20250 [Terriglobales bacterium]|jgi:hypothetical protein
MTQPLMTQALQLLTVVAVGFGLACYGLIQGRRERNAERQVAADPRQQPLFPPRETKQHPAELVTR